MKIVLPIAPVAKGRPRMTRAGHCYTPDATRQFENTCRQWLTLEMRRGGFAMFNEPIWVSMTFTLARPKSVKRIAPSVKPDCTNLAKSLEDAANGILWVDDALICRLIIEKRYGETPMIEIQAETLIERDKKIESLKANQPNVKVIVTAYLKAHGLEGLGCEECSCSLPDLMPCGDNVSDCQPGKKIDCPEGCGCVVSTSSLRREHDNQHRSPLHASRSFCQHQGRRKRCGP